MDRKMIRISAYLPGGHSVEKQEVWININYVSSIETDFRWKDAAKIKMTNGDEYYGVEGYRGLIALLDHFINKMGEPS